MPFFRTLAVVAQVEQNSVYDRKDLHRGVSEENGERSALLVVLAHKGTVTPPMAGPRFKVLQNSSSRFGEARSKPRADRESPAKANSRVPQRWAAHCSVFWNIS